MKKCNKCGFEHDRSNLIICLDGQDIANVCINCFANLLKRECGVMVYLNNPGMGKLDKAIAFFKEKKSWLGL